MDGLTSKQRYKEVDKRSGGLCEVCYSSHMVQNHHIIYGRGKRNQCETVYSIKKLCWDCHHGDYGVHGKYGKGLDNKLKDELEITYQKLGLSEEEINKYMGRTPFKTTKRFR